MVLPPQYAWFEPVLIASIVVFIIDLIGNSITFSNRYVSSRECNCVCRRVRRSDLLRPRQGLDVRQCTIRPHNALIKVATQIAITGHPPRCRQSLRPTRSYRAQRRRPCTRTY